MVWTMVWTMVLRNLCIEYLANASEEEKNQLADGLANQFA